ncbi:hypothetical protein BGZ65_001170 [Modicella reniformis]|uniref:Splicing factor 3B subunit 4 n=1 Tax=Modicella reniformis TaxID=1440133 RepID=A0A9P6J241_9FUNG|nr:hypothetical protein BGZ65_001170 [Modicella reniformis]
MPWYKQAIFGDLETTAPGFQADAKPKAKWDAWNGKKELKTAEAEEQYIALVEKLSNSRRLRATEPSLFDSSNDMAQPIERNQDATVYVGNLDDRCTDSLIWELMAQAGPVVNVHLPKDRVTQTHQNYGFCEYVSEEDADYACKILNQVKLYGKPLRINKATSDRKNLDVGASLFIGNLSPDADEALLRDTFSAFGTIVGHAKIARDLETGQSKGYGFVSFDNFESSDAAIDAMDGQILANKPITVSYAYKKDGKGERHGSAADIPGTGPGGFTPTGANATGVASISRPPPPFSQPPSQPPGMPRPPVPYGQQPPPPRFGGYPNHLQQQPQQPPQQQSPYHGSNAIPLGQPARPPPFGAMPLPGAPPVPPPPPGMYAPNPNQPPMMQGGPPPGYPPMQQPGYPGAPPPMRPPGNYAPYGAPPPQGFQGYPNQ